MEFPDSQSKFWDANAGSKEFSHPLPVDGLRQLLATQASILDYGCGYGRSMMALSLAGFSQTFGVDISSAMVKKGLGRHPSLNFTLFDGNNLPFSIESFEAALMVAVLNCIPSRQGQAESLQEVCRVLKPGGLLFLSDYPLQADPRNVERYKRHQEEFGEYGVFRTRDGGVFRHLDPGEIPPLLESFEILELTDRRVLTMNGNPADIFQILARKKIRETRKGKT